MNSRRLRKGIGADMAAEDQEMYMVYFVEGYLQDEIAKMEGVSQNTISKKIRRITK